MASERPRSGRTWKTWLAIYVAIGAVASAVVYVAFFAHGGSGFHY